MKRSTALKLVFALLLTCASFTGAARPAHAIYCGSSFLGCYFIGVQSYGSAICCTYRCPDGRVIRGLCQQV